MNWILYKSDGRSFTWVKTDGAIHFLVSAELQRLGGEFIKPAQAWVFYYEPDEGSLNTLLGEPTATISGVKTPPRAWSDAEAVLPATGSRDGGPTIVDKEE